MDISEIYIKMRLQATGDLGFGVPPSEVLVRSDYRYISIDTKGDWYYDNFSLCQLERQDQLQEMAGSDWVDVFDRFCCSINEGMDEWFFDNEVKAGSMEQLWLVFVMKELYNKIWSGTEWVEG